MKVHIFPDMAPNVRKRTYPGRRLSAGALQANGLESYHSRVTDLFRTQGLRCCTPRSTWRRTWSTRPRARTQGETCLSGQGLSSPNLGNREERQSNMSIDS